MKQNNIVCKHLWQVINTLDENMELFLENLIPYYKKMYGFSKNGSEDMLLKQIGATGFRKTTTHFERIRKKHSTTGESHHRY